MTVSEPGPATRGVWGGEERYLVDGATQVPVVHSVSFGYDDYRAWHDVATGQALALGADLVVHSATKFLGGHADALETIIGPPATTSHVECTPEERAELGIPEGLIRYSAGIEDEADLLSDLAQTLDAI